MFYCTGGHGRTGTALAAMLIDGTWEAADSIDYIRKHYCDKDVETAAQEDALYLLEFKLNKRETPKKVTPDAPPPEKKLSRKERKRLLRERNAVQQSGDALHVDFEDVAAQEDTNHYNCTEWWRE